MLRVEYEELAASAYSEPQPDVAVVPPGDYRHAHPSEAWLVIEVAGSSLRKDSGLKARLYAECGVPEYWVVDLAANVVEVHTEIASGRCTRVARYTRENHVALVRFADVTIDLAQMLR